MRSYLEKIGIKPVKDKKNSGKFKNWLDVEASRWPYALWNKNRLIDACTSKFGGKKSSYNGYDKGRGAGGRAEFWKGSVRGEIKLLSRRCPSGFF